MFNPRVPRHVVFVYGGYENGLPSSTLKVLDIRSSRLLVALMVWKCVTMSDVSSQQQAVFMIVHQ